MPKLVTIYGGSGFVGRYIARACAKAGYRVRVAVRRPNEAMFVKPYGVVGQVEPVFCNIRDDASVAAVMQGADVVVNCVGILAPDGKNTFDSVQHEGAERIARIAADQGVAKMVHISAIGADLASTSDYAVSKAKGEEGVLAHMPEALILRPSIVFGHEDEFFNRFASMARFSPTVPVVGAETRFQPVYVEDVAKAAMQGIDGSASGIYELGGPDVSTFRELMGQMLKVIQRRRMVVGLPIWVGHLMGMGFGVMNFLSLGLIKPDITRDQVRNLAVDNVVGDKPGLGDLGVKPTALEAVLPDYLWRYRPSGQYAAIKQSAQNLRD